MTLQCKVITITPVKARELLQENTGNFRLLNQDRITHFATDMSNGQWEMNGETIKFGSNGIMLDGQHRLHAVIKADVAVDMLVVTGIRVGALHIDRGRPRTIGQWLKHAGIKNANAIAAMTRLAIVHDNGQWSHRGVGIAKITDTASIAFAEAHGEAMQTAYQGKGSHAKGISRATLGAILFIGNGRKALNGESYASWFKEKLADGVDVGDTEPVLHLRNRLMNQTATSGLTPFMVRMITTLAWNFTVQGRECKAAALRFQATGPNKTARFPSEILEAPEAK